MLSLENYIQLSYTPLLPKMAKNKGRHPMTGLCMHISQLWVKKHCQKGGICNVNIAQWTLDAIRAGDAVPISVDDEIQVVLGV
jgi:hypothetical protein